MTLAARQRVPRRANTPTTRPESNVVCVGIGPKIVGSKLTDRTAVRLYVQRKLDRRLIGAGHLLPGTIEGVETDVIETGRFKAQGLTARKRLRPCRPGCSVGFQLPPPHDDLIMAGTLAAVVERDGKRFILSNNHVLAGENNLAPGAPIFQPGLLDHGDPASDAIARLAEFVPLTTDGPNRVDCAIAELDDHTLAGTRALAKVHKLSSREPIDAAVHAPVEKTGRGSGYTQGTIEDANADLTIEYEMGELHFVDQLLIRGSAGRFSEYGDSGALVVDVGSRQATGLLIGGSDGFSIANHFDDVLQDLNVTLVL